MEPIVDEVARQRAKRAVRDYDERLLVELAERLAAGSDPAERLCLALVEAELDRRRRWGRPA